MSRTIDEAISELEREAHIRIRCYDRWIQEGKVSRVDAWDRLERLLSGIKHLRKFADALRTEAETPLETAPESSLQSNTVPADFSAMHNAVDRAAKIGA